MAVHCLILAATEDRKYQRELEDQLAVYVQQRFLTLGSLDGAPAGAEVTRWREQLLGQAGVIVILISPRFERTEADLLAAAVARRNAGVRVVPVLLKSIDVIATRYRDLVVLPRNGMPILEQPRRDRAWLDVAKELRALLPGTAEMAQTGAGPGAGTETLLLSWLHLSDLHFGHGSTSHRYNQQRMLAALAQDIRGQVRAGTVPSPDLILVTGDIAFSGGDQSRPPVEDEYGHAAAWLDGLASSLQVPLEHIVMVPGNHDVARSADRDPETKKLVADLREGTSSLDDAVCEEVGRMRLLGRQARYRAFASRYARPDSAHAAESGWTSHSLTIRGFAVRILGLNTALLAADDRDHGRLRVGQRMLTELLSGLVQAADSEQLVLSLSHHPLSGGWLADQREVKSWLARHVHCHLAGHVHEAESEAARSGSGAEWLSITAGAAHAEAVPQGVAAGHGYSVTAVFHTPSGVRLRTWPRRFSDANADFRPDIDRVDPRTQYAEHVLRLQRRAPGEVL